LSPYDPFKKKVKLLYLFFTNLAKSGIEPKLTDHETIVPPLHYFAYIFMLLRVIRFELMISIWKIEVIPLNYTRFNLIHNTYSLLNLILK
jgi:hypothetical protein